MTSMSRMPLARYSPFLVTMLLCAGICASGLYWSALFAPYQAYQSTPIPPARAKGNPPDAKSLFGWQGGMAIESRHFQLKGLLLAGKPENSVAVLAVDDWPARTFRVGTAVAAGVSLAEIHSRHVVIIEGGSARRIELPSGAAGYPDNKEFKSLGLPEHGDLESGNGAHPDNAREPESNRSYPLNAQNPFFGRIRHSAAS